MLYKLQEFVLANPTFLHKNRRASLKWSDNTQIWLKEDTKLFRRRPLKWRSICAIVKRNIG